MNLTFHVDRLKRAETRAQRSLLSECREHWVLRAVTASRLGMAEGELHRTSFDHVYTVMAGIKMKAIRLLGIFGLTQ